MTFDIFFSICQVEVDGVLPSERVMLENFMEQARAADRLGYGTAWIAESHLSSETQKKNASPVIPHFKGEIGLSVDFLQTATRVFAATERMNVGSAVFNILCNGGPIAAAERVRTFLSWHGLDAREKRRLELGFAAGRFPYINAPYGIVPRDEAQKADWRALVNKIFIEATEIFLRLVKGEELSSDDLQRRALETVPWWTFERLKIVPQDSPLDLLRLTIGSHDPAAQIFANTLMPVGVFNLSITSREVVESTNERMTRAYHPAGGPWRRALMPRTTLVFVDPEPERARERAKKALTAYWQALEGTLDPKKVESATDNALIGDPDTIERQMRERFDPTDRLMLWFDFFNHDSRAVVRDMELFMREVAPRFEQGG